MPGTDEPLPDFSDVQSGSSSGPASSTPQRTSTVVAGDNQQFEVKK
jgi:hypothetical protein